jgi:hypothetical protein
VPGAVDGDGSGGRKKASPAGEPVVGGAGAVAAGVVVGAAVVDAPAVEEGALGAGAPSVSSLPLGADDPDPLLQAATAIAIAASPATTPPRVALR